MLSGIFPPLSAHHAVATRLKHSNEDDIRTATTTTETTTDQQRNNEVQASGAPQIAVAMASTATSSCGIGGTTTAAFSSTIIAAVGGSNGSSGSGGSGSIYTTSAGVTAGTAAAAAAATSGMAVAQQRNRSADRSGLERAYVHDVYENCEENVGPIRPRVAQFLAALDRGSTVCDVGCGNGRYLAGCNPLVYSIGVDRCYRLAKVAKSKGGEVAICDNLELPFRDESFDAVLSLAVIHHFATTERRVGAIRELARILRIGGRVIITVWALEQRQRRFESQDVLIPWQPPKCRNANTSDEEDDEDFLPPYHAYTEDSTNSSKSAGDGDSSSLSSSSPGESCYSFVRRAIQKLAGGRRHPWFPDSWNSKDTKHGSSLDYEDAKDLPIELRRLEDFDDIPEPPLSAGLKSRSLGSILNPPPRAIVRSRSSVPSLGAQLPEQKQPISSMSSGGGGCGGNGSHSGTGNISGCGVGSGNNVASGAVSGAIASAGTSGGGGGRPKLVKQKQSLCEDDFPLDESPLESRPAALRSTRSEESRAFLRKQSSLNEELMAENRLREKERVRKRIQKQMSLNEAFLCRSLFSKRLQVIREEFTMKLKTSTGSLERATSGIVKIMQNLKGAASHEKSGATEPPKGVASKGKDTGKVSDKAKEETSNDDQKPRRHSRESGSDSSKDSSLQSDTSIESEDSFASVIYIPRPAELSAGDGKISSVPTSPLVMCPPTPAHSPLPRCKIQAANNTIVEPQRFTFEEEQYQKADNSTMVSSSQSQSQSQLQTQSQPPPSIAVPQIKVIAPVLAMPTLAVVPTKVRTSTGASPKITRQTIKNLPPIPKFRKHPSFPIVRRVSAAPAMPKLKSLEIFNPETDDLDSDSSEASSPDSINSVINALKPNGDDLTAVTSDVARLDELDDLHDGVTLAENTSAIAQVEDDEDGDGLLSRQHLVDFAERLSAQLLKELDDRASGRKEKRSTVDDPYVKKLNGELRDLKLLREELRERRLMLANLNGSSREAMGSTNSIIHEEDESPRENCSSFDSENTANTAGSGSISHRDTALLLEGDDDYEIDTFEELNNNKQHVQQQQQQQLQYQSRLSGDANANVMTAGKGSSTGTAIGTNGNFANNRTLSQDSWGGGDHSASTASLDSPSVGGAATHHRYYHVFREGELDALINHHVASLHIVSSYYERASWCVVAEKVQVWTI